MHTQSHVCASSRAGVLTWGLSLVRGSTFGGGKHISRMATCHLLVDGKMRALPVLNASPANRAQNLLPRHVEWGHNGSDGATWLLLGALGLVPREEKSVLGNT